MSKGIFWKDPNDDIQILDATEEASIKYGHYAGYDLLKLNTTHLQALQAGKMLAWNDSEYSTFVILEKDD